MRNISCSISFFSTFHVISRKLLFGQCRERIANYCYQTLNTLATTHQGLQYIWYSCQLHRMDQDRIIPTTTFRPDWNNDQYDNNHRDDHFQSISLLYTWWETFSKGINTCEFWPSWILAKISLHSSVSRKFLYRLHCSTPAHFAQYSAKYTVPKVIDFPRYNMKYSGENVILRGIVHVVSRFPLHFMFYRGNFDSFSNSVCRISLNDL